MPEYSPKELRLYIDDLDAVLRRSVVENNLRTVFASEKKRISALMLATRVCKEIPALMNVIIAPRFVWRLTRAWSNVRSNPEALSHFWDTQSALLQGFDRDHPSHFGQEVSGPRPILPNAMVAQENQVSTMTPAPLRDSAQSVPVPSVSQPPVPVPPRQSVPVPVVSQPARIPAPRQSVPGPAPIPAPRQSVPGPAPIPAPRQSVPVPIASQPAPTTVSRQSVPVPVVSQPAQLPVPRQSAPIPAPRKSVPVPAASKPAPLPVPRQSVPVPVAGESKHRKPPVPVPAPQPGPSHQKSHPKSKPTQPQQRSPSPRYINRFDVLDVLNLPDTDAEGSVDEEIVEPIPVPKNKGKRKDADDEDIVEPIPVPKNKGKRKDDVDPPILRKPPCKKCLKSKKKCIEQTHHQSSACVNCARLKMKCQPASEEGSDEEFRLLGSSSPPPPTPEPSIHVIRKVPPPVPVPKQKRPTENTASRPPVPDPSQRQAPTKKAATKRSAPVPESGPPPKRRKQVKTAINVDTSDEEEEDKDKRKGKGKKKGRTLEELQNYYDVRIEKMEGRMRQMEDLIHNHQSIQDKYEGLYQAANKKTDLLEDMVREQTGMIVEQNVRITKAFRIIHLLSNPLVGDLQNPVVARESRTVVRSDVAGPSSTAESPIVISDHSPSPPPRQAQDIDQHSNETSGNRDGGPEGPVAPDNSTEKHLPPVVDSQGHISCMVPNKEQSFDSGTGTDQPSNRDLGLLETEQITSGTGTGLSSDVGNSGTLVGVETEDLISELADAVLAEAVSPAAEEPGNVMPEESQATSGPVPLPNEAPSSMPPPVAPQLSDVPQVNLLPPTPISSQDAETTQTRLVVPDPTDIPSDQRRSRSRSHTPIPESSERRRSPRLGSPSSGVTGKRPASDELGPPVSKKSKEG